MDRQDLCVLRVGIAPNLLDKVSDIVAVHVVMIVLRRGLRGEVRDWTGGNHLSRLRLKRHAYRLASHDLTGTRRERLGKRKPPNWH